MRVDLSIDSSTGESRQQDTSISRPVPRPSGSCRSASRACARPWLGSRSVVENWSNRPRLTCNIVLWHNSRSHMGKSKGGKIQEDNPGNPAGGGAVGEEEGGKEGKEDKKGKDDMTRKPKTREREERSEANKHWRPKSHITVPLWCKRSRRCLTEPLASSFVARRTSNGRLVLPPVAAKEQHVETASQGAHCQLSEGFPLLAFLARRRGRRRGHWRRRGSRHGRRRGRRNGRKRGRQRRP